MASILQIKGKWRALIRRKGRPPICKTHPTKAAAVAWARGIEAQLDVGVEPERSGLTVGELLQAYRKLRDGSRPILDSSDDHYVLGYLERMLGRVDARRLSTEDLVAFCMERREQGAGPATINMDIGRLSTALRYAASARGLALPDSVGAARPLLKHLGHIGGTKQRVRRPTPDELDRLVKHLRETRAPVFADAVEFAVATAMRRAEICGLQWADVDAEKRLVLIRDRKDPRHKIGNHQLVPLLPAAWEILQRQPRDTLIFPINPPLLSKYFTLACEALSIPDLHFHDLRHEGTSQLFEAGYEIPQVALVTGHRKWDNLRRYTQLKPEGLHRS